MSLIVDVLTGGVNNHETTSEAVNGIATDFITEGIVGAVNNTSGVAPMTGGYGVEAQGTPDMTVAVDAGTAYVTGTPSTQVSQTFRVKNSASSNVTISANSSGSTKYDWVYIKLDATKLNGPNSAGDDVATLVTSRSSSASTDDGTPPTYGYALAVVTVANGATSITNSMIRDIRTQSAVNAGASSGASTWTDTGYAPGTVTALGNRSYSLVFANTDLTGFLSNGMRLKLTRTVTAPTQCADLEASSSHYFSKTSPAGLSFTTTFTVGAWVKLESYTQGGIIARRNADTEGWSLIVKSDGAIQLAGLRIASNNKAINSYQSIPLNKWVHVAATMDMAVGDTSAQKIWIDGVEVPRSYTLTGTASALVQGTTALVVGAHKSAGTEPFDGKIAQAFVASAQISTANINTIKDQGLTAALVATHSIVSAFSLSNSLVDINTTSANDVSAVNSAVATNADTPFAGGSVGTTEYGIITKNAFSTDTTLTVQVPEGYAIPTSGGVSAVAYSTQSVPYGFPRDKNKWSVLATALSTLTASGSTTATWYASNLNLTIPIGDWSISYYGSVQGTATSGALTVYGTLSTSSATESSVMNSTSGRGDNLTILASPLGKELPGVGSLTVATTYYFNIKVAGTSPSSLSLRNDNGAAQILAYPAYV